MQWESLRIEVSPFTLAAYASPVLSADSDVLTVYIEGDGLAWLNPSTPSSDPTPLDPIALRLAVQHPVAPVAWLARPCQYFECDGRPPHAVQWWTSHRFAEQVVVASNSAIDRLLHRAHARSVVLIGYSGGAAIAALVAARRTDVARLITVAGNLDHRAWTDWHSLTPLSGSLNPADIAPLLTHVPQVHWVGGRDRIVGRQLADSYLERIVPADRPPVRIALQADHRCCWVNLWPELLRESAEEFTDQARRSKARPHHASRSSAEVRRQKLATEGSGGTSCQTRRQRVTIPPSRCCQVGGFDPATGGGI